MVTGKPQLKRQDIGDVSLEYLNYANSGTTIILMHATGFLPWLWHPIARELSKSFNIIVPYFCDHRDTAVEDGLSWRILAHDLKMLCQKLKIDQPVIVGHSMGAAVGTIAVGSFKLAAQYLILIEPIFLPRDIYTIDLKVEHHPLASKSIRRRNFWQNKKEAKTYLKSKPLFENWDEEMLDLYIQYGITPGEDGGFSLTCSPEREAALFMGSCTYDPWPILHQISCPVLVLEGENTDVRFINFKQIAASFQHGKYLQIKDAGHLIPMEKPFEIIKIIKNSLNV